MNCPTCGEDMDPALGQMGLGVHPTCGSVPADPDTVVMGIFDTVRDAIVNQPRSLQKRIGPSEIGHPCQRRIGHKLAGTPEVNGDSVRGVAWKPFVGTSVHEQMANIMAKAEVARWSTTEDDVSPRWHVEERVTVGTIGGVAISGSTDLFDGHHGIVFDWKFTSKNQIKNYYKPHGPGDQYRIQAHLYGLGWKNAGHDVRHVAILFLTREGEYTDRYVWHEPFDERVAIDALKRLEEIQTGIDSLGADFMIPLLPTTEAWCGNCPFFKVGATDLTKACPGETERVKRDAVDPFN